MADNRCPLCMERLKNGECASCGYKIPDEENISSIYDAEPSAEFQPEPAMREITPEIQMEEIYPNREEPKFKVRDDEGRTVKVDLNKHKEEADVKPNTSNGNPYASNGNPYADYTPQGVPNKTDNSPFANQSVYTTVDTDSVSAYFKKFWWLLLLAFVFPIPAVIVNAVIKNETKKYKANYLFIIAIVLGIII